MPPVAPYLSSQAFDADHHRYFRMVRIIPAEMEHDLDFGYHIREAGSTAVQEIAFTLGNGKAYMRGSWPKGLDIDVFW